MASLNLQNYKMIIQMTSNVSRWTGPQLLSWCLKEEMLRTVTS